MVCFLTVLQIVADEILFRWAPNRSKLLREFWEDYALVMETLEENQVENTTRLSVQAASWCPSFVTLRYSLSLQVHVVRPVLNRIDTLIQTTVNDSQGNTSQFSFFQLQTQFTWKSNRSTKVTLKICRSRISCLFPLSLLRLCCSFSSRPLPSLVAAVCVPADVPQRE